MKINSKCCICGVKAVGLIDLKPYCAKCFNNVSWENKCKRTNKKLKLKKERIHEETLKHQRIIQRRKYDKRNN